MPLEYDFEKLGKEIVVSRLKDEPNPYEFIGDIIRKTLVSAVGGTRDRQDPHMTISAACRGVMNGILLIEKDPAKTTIVLLSQMAQVAQETQLDPADCMTWAMEGIAPVAKMSSNNTCDAVRAAIEENFMGAGTVFDELLRRSQV